MSGCEKEPLTYQSVGVQHLLCGELCCQLSRKVLIIMLTNKGNFPLQKSIQPIVLQVHVEAKD